ncbi:MAG: YfhO family protein [Chloroflexi bacterium]|nr:YfhO family protein [Chloroflexota bacterium]
MNTERHRRRADFLALAAFIVTVVVFYWPELSGQAIFFFGGFDNPLIYYPYRAILSDAIRSGHLPLWTALLGTGFPLAADPESASFSIVAILLSALLPPAMIMNIEHILVVLGSGLGTYAFARSLDRSPVAAFIAAVAFAFGGPVVGRSETLFMAGAFPWLPLLFLGLERTAARKSMRAAIFSGFIMAMLVLAGSPQIAVFSIIGGCLYFSVRAAFEWRNDAGLAPAMRHISRLGVALVIGALLSAIQLLPALEFSRETDRGTGGPTSGAAAISFSLPELITYLEPFSLYLVPTLTRGADVKTYIGIVPLILAILAVWRRRDRHTLSLAVVYLFGLLYALGQLSPVWWLLHGLPALSSFRNPGYFMHIAGLAAAVLAAFGMDELLAATPSSVTARAALKLARLFAVAGVLCWLAAGIGQLALSTPQVRDAALAYGRRYIEGGGRDELSAAHYTERLSLIYDRLVDRVGVATPYYGLPAALMLAGAALVRARVRGDLAANAFALAAAGLVILDGFHFSYFLDAQRSLPVSAFTAAPDSLASLQSDASPFRVISAYSPEERNTLYWRSRATLQQLNVDLLMPNIGAAFGQTSVQGYYGIVLARDIESLLGPTGQSDSERVARLAAQSRVLGAVNVKYLLVPPGIAVPGWSSRYNGRSDIYQNPDYLPRAYLVPTARVMADPTTIIEAMQSPAFSPRREVILEQPAALAGVAMQSGTARIESATAERVTIHAELDGAGYLVLSDRYYPGWRARVDGRDATILRANYYLRAVALTAGAHTVEFTYEPESVRLGMTITGLTAVSIALLGVYDMIGRARRPAPN